MNMKRFGLTLVAAAVGFGISGNVLANGDTTSTNSTSGDVVDSVTISSGLSDISLGDIDFFDGTTTQATGNFTVKANATDTLYDVWLTVPTGNFENSMVVAIDGTNKLPLEVVLTGNTDVNANLANLNNTQPSSASTADGDGVSGTDANNGTQYTVTVSEKLDAFETYSSIPNGNYTVAITANIVLN